MRWKSVNTIQLYFCNLTVKLFLSLYDKTSHQKENNVSLPLTATYASQYIRKRKRRGYNLNLINAWQEYFQPKIGRKVRIFSLGRKNDVLVKRKECIMSWKGENRFFFFFLAIINNSCFGHLCWSKVHPSQRKLQTWHQSYLMVFWKLSLIRVAFTRVNG